FAAIDTIEKAKEFKYNGNKALETNEKKVFESNLLKEKDSSGNETLKVENLKKTLALLINFKEASDKLEVAEKRTAGLVTEEVDLLDALMEARRNGLVEYKAIIGEEPNNEEKIDKLIRSYQLINLREDNRNLATQKIKLEKEIGTLTAKRKKLDGEVEKKKSEYTYQRKEELKDYKRRVNDAITRLKNGLGTGQPGLLILNEAINTNQKSSNVLFKTANTYPDSVPSIIETSVKSPYSTNNKYTHPSYLTEDLSGQMMDLFKQFDKDKLFTLITKQFDATEAKKIKGAYERVVNAKVEYVSDFIDQEEFIPELLGSGEVVTGRGNTLYYETLEEANEKNLFLSDIFYFMNAFFPQNSAGLDFSNSDFLKEGNEKALPFTGTNNNLVTDHRIVWRGRDDNLVGRKYKDTPNIGAYTIDPHYPPESLQLMKKVLDKDGVSLIPARSEEISVYENKLRYVGIQKNNDENVLGVSFINWAKEVLINGDASANIDVCNNSFDTFREEAREITYNDMKKDDHEMKIIAQSKLDDFDKGAADLGKKVVERNGITAQINDKEQKLNNNKLLRDGLKNTKVENLKRQFKRLGKKITDETNPTIITRQESAAIKNLYHLLKKLENKTTLGTDTDGDNLDSYVTKVEALEKEQEEEDSIRYHLEEVKKALNNAKKRISLSTEEDAELLAITSYLAKSLEITDSDIRLAFNLYKDIPNKLDNARLREVGSFVNNLEDKTPFFTELRTYIEGKSGAPTPPPSTADEYEMLDYYYTLSPEYLIGSRAVYEIKHDSTLKESQLNKMKAEKDGDKPLDISKSGYGNGKEYTEDGIAKFYSEELGHKKHSYHGPADAEGNGDDDENDDKK
ncbi:17198_t:CDS:2, partial [Funneliformis geosporum]